jgi:segregation and condensation protein A
VPEDISNIPLNDEGVSPAQPSPVPTETPVSASATALDPLGASPAGASILTAILHPEDQKPTYQITLPVFDGPMDLLLHLLKEHQVDIYDIPIALITKEYLSVLELMESLNLEVAGDFLVMAATLMQIKSRMLLPLEPGADGEEPEDPRTELVRRLIEYKQFKDAADRLSDLEKDRGRLFPRNVPEEWKQSAEEEHLVEVTLFGLLSAFKDVLIHSQGDITTELMRPEITITQKINDLMDVLQEKREVEFKSLLGEMRHKIEKIVTFLALLELVRLKLVKAYQQGAYGEIRICLTENAPGVVATPPEQSING